MSRLTLNLSFCLIAAAAICSSTLHAQESRTGSWDVTFENDKWGSGSDRHYTHGTRITRRSEQVPNWLRRAADSLACLACINPTAAALEFGQEIYTPEETWRTDLIEYDRPYAGWTYAKASLFAERDTAHMMRKAFNAIGLQVGVVGPASLAERTQKLIHREKDVGMSQGWDNQLNNELGVVLTYTRGVRRTLGRATGAPLRHDVSPYFVGALGNVLTHVGGGIRLRSGVNLGSFGVVIAPGWHLFMDVEARAVAWNIFLDGNTRSESHSVDKMPFVGRVAAGFEFSGARLRLRVASEVRSREFYGQRQPDRFSSLTFSVHP